MECKFIQHGLALSYNQVVKPCCSWQITPEWKNNNQLSAVDLSSWHKSKVILDQKKILDNNQWPSSCIQCQQIENQGRFDSMRGNGNHSYADYQEDDITLEIRPGNTCNFACQTCWPEASSRVAQYHSQAGLIDIQNLDSSRYTNFDFLLPVADRIRDVVLLGGEPFYDKACLAFLSWANKNLTSHLMVFTNGSVVDFEFLKTYPGKISLIFSIDAVGRAAEYVRYGTVWEEVLNNYLQAKELDNVDVRVNITLSVYNYNLIEQVVDLLCESWPGVVSFGVPHQAYLKEISIPLELRPELIENLNQAISVLQNTDIHKDQKTNAVNALTSTVNNLKQLDFDLDSYKKLITFIKTMDQVKGINAGDYSDFLSKLLQYKLS